jgi:hypothetical protein
MATEQNKINVALPGLYFLITDQGELAGFHAPNGTITYFPASGCDNALTAFAGGGQANALQLNYRKSRVTTVATAADSVKLPKAKPGMEMTVVNAAAVNAMNVFPSSGESINALSADTALSVAANKTITFHCITVGVWNSVLTA